MKTRFVVVLLLFNVAALAAGFVYFAQHAERQVAQDQESAGAELQAWQTRAKAQTAAAIPTVKYKTNAFNWNQVETTNYRQYIANLARHRVPGSHDQGHCSHGCDAPLCATSGSILP
jgi:flagellar basal body-associated protein FliL